MKDVDCVLKDDELTVGISKNLPALEELQNIISQIDYVLDTIDELSKKSIKRRLAIVCMLLSEHFDKFEHELAKKIVIERILKDAA